MNLECWVPSNTGLADPPKRQNGETYAPDG